MNFWLSYDGNLIWNVRKNVTKKINGKKKFDNNQEHNANYGKKKNFMTNFVLTFEI